MPKLVIDFDVEFEAGPIIAHDRDLMSSVKVPAARLRALVAKAAREDFAVTAVLLERGKSGYSFDCRHPIPGTTTVFDWAFNFGKRTVKVLAKGELATRSLRPGVAPFIQRLGKTADFRLWGFRYNGGAWNGFEAPVIGFEEDACKSWFRLRTWRLK